MLEWNVYNSKKSVIGPDRVLSKSRDDILSKSDPGTAPHGTATREQLHVCTKFLVHLVLSTPLTVNFVYGDVVVVTILHYTGLIAATCKLPRQRNAAIGSRNQMRDTIQS
jgi:hypothetical protein